MNDNFGNTPIATAEAQDIHPQFTYSRRRVQIGLSVTLFGFLIFLLGIRPDVFGLDRSPVIGFVQVAVFLIGLAFLCIGGYLSIMALWKYDTPSILADFGLRVVATGYVVCVVTGMADIFGFGTDPLPSVPYFGPLQAVGVQIGQYVIAIGLLMLIPYHRFSEMNSDQ
jgi:hypothetical protein